MASSLETNKALAALLTAGVIASGAGVMSRIIYSPEFPEEPAYRIEVASAEVEAEEAPAEDAVPFAQLLAAADVGAGEGAAKKCAACHSFDAGGANKIGPALYDVVGRDIAAVDGFAYSDALLGAEGDWDYAALDGFLADPKGWSPGTKMAFAGVTDDQERADLVVYLRSLADDPLPLPEVDESATAEDTPADEGAETAADEGAADDGEAETAEAAPEEESAADEAESETAEATPAEEEAADGGEAATAEAASEGADEAEGETADAAAADEGGASDTAEAAPEEDTAADATDEGAAEEDVAALETEAAVAETEGGEAGAGAADGIGALLAVADVAAGEKSVRKCAACHSFDQGGANKIGPALWGIVGRDIAAADGYSYSDALAGTEGEWDYQALDGYLEKPKEWVPGTKMAFAGVRKPEERADIILYLRSLAEDPAPLP